MTDDYYIRRCEVCSVRVGKISFGKFRPDVNFAGFEYGDGYRCKDHAETTTEDYCPACKTEGVTEGAMH